MSSRHKTVSNHFVLHRAIMALVISAVICCGASAFGQDDWKAEFDDICAKTDQAMTLSKAELIALVERCDKLKTSIEQLEETQKKVYLRRLQLCRNLFAFTIDTLKNK